MAEQYRKVACPTCGKMLEWHPKNAWRPFCSERCKLIDLGQWADEKFKLPVEESDALAACRTLVVDSEKRPR